MVDNSITCCSDFLGSCLPYIIELDGRIIAVEPMVYLMWRDSVGLIRNSKGNGVRRDLRRGVACEGIAGQ